MDRLTERRKRGPRPKGFIRQHVFLPADLAEWAKNHPEGLSGLVRRLLKDEQQRQEQTTRRDT